MITIHPEVKCLLFDCDGTLADTMGLHLEAWDETFTALGEKSPPAFLDGFRGVPTETIVEYLNETYGYNFDVKAFAKDKNIRVKQKLSHAEPIDPVIEIAVRYKNRFPMAVVSGGTRDNVLVILEAIGLKDFFDIILTANDDIKPKPSPDIFLEAAKRLNVKPEHCQVFEDGDPGLESARSAGMIATDVRLYI